VKIDEAIEATQRSEVELGTELGRLAERHAADHDVYHGGHQLVGTCAQHLERLRPLAERYGVDPADPDETRSSSLLETVREKASAFLGRTEVAGALLLSDLRHTYLVAQQAEIDWTILRQAALAARDQQLLDVVEHCHEEVELAAKWLRTVIKASAPQVLVSG
jgi:hypothetical protein